jgi:hypothetical protein
MEDISRQHAVATRAALVEVRDAVPPALAGRRSILPLGNHGDPAASVAGAGRFISRKTWVQANNSSDNLTHTTMLRPSDSPLLVEAAMLLTPRVADYGALLFGERLGWSLKEMWVNVHGLRRPSGHAQPCQQLHLRRRLSHAHPPGIPHDVHEGPGGTEFAFKNDHAGVITRPLQRGEVDQPPARTGGFGDVSQLPHARGATEQRRTAHHHALQRHSGQPGFLGLQDFSFSG